MFSCCRTRGGYSALKRASPNPTDQISADASKRRAHSRVTQVLMIILGLSKCFAVHDITCTSRM